MTLDQALQLVARRARLARANQVADRALTIACGLGVIVYLTLAFWPIAVITPGELLLGLAAVMGLAWLWTWAVSRPDRRRCALILDARLRLSERTATAVHAETATDPGFTGEVRAALRDQVNRALAAVPSAAIERAIPLRVPVGALVSLAVIFLVVVAAPWLPRFPAPSWAQPASTPALAEAKAVREAARKLDERAATLERAARKIGLPEARQSAQVVGQKAQELEHTAQDARSALARLSKAGDGVRAKAAEQLGRPSPSDQTEPRSANADPFGVANDLGEASRLAEELDRLDPHGSEVDFQDLAKDLLAEEQRAQSEGRDPAADARRLDEALARVKQLEAALKRVTELLQKNPELARKLAQVTARQLALMQKIAGEIERLRAAKPGQADSRKRQSPGSCAQALSQLSEAELEKILRELQELESLNALQQMIEAAKCEAAGGALPGDAEALAATMRALEAQGRASPAGERGEGASPANQQGDGSNQGSGVGGTGKRGADDGRDETTFRVHGRVDPTKPLGPRIPFRGIPKANEAQGALDAAIQRAAGDAEQSLGRDDLPPDARPFVKRYFDALREKKQ